MDCNLKTSGDSDNKIVVFASVPEKKDLCCIIAYINSEEKIDKSAKSMFHWQILKCRQIIFTEPEIIASPVMGAENQIYIIMDREYHDCGKIQIQLEKLKLLAFESTAVTNSIYEACLRYTLIARIAPLWNQVENYLIQGRDFLSATSPANAIKMDIGINDGEMFVLLWPTKVRLPLLKFEDLDVPTQISQDFISHSTGFISETALGSQWIHVLPSLKRGRLISVSHEIPDNCPFRTYKELKRHWKNLYGYRLPEDAENRVYYTLHFHPLSPTFYTYPDVCVRPQGLMFLRRVDQLGVLKAFLSDLTKKLPTVCGQPFAINPKVAYAVPKLQKLNERTVLHIFRRKSQLFTRETSPIIINGHCLPEDDENRVYYTLHFYPLSPTFYTYPDVCVQPQGLMFLRHVDQLGVLKAFRSNFTKKLPTVCGQPFAFNPKVAYAVPKLHKLNEVPDLARANLTSSPYLKTNKNLIPIEPTFITSPTNDYQMEYNVINSLSSQNDMFASQTTASLCSRNLSLMTPSESTSRDERSNIPTALPGSTPAYMQYSLLCRRASPSNPDPGKPQPRYVPIFKRKYLPSQYCNQNNQPVSSAVGHVTEVTRSGQIYKPTFGHSVISEAMSQNMKYGTSPSRQVYKMVYNYKRTSDQGSWSEETMKKAPEECRTNPINSVATKYGLPFSTLYRHYKSGSSKKQLGRFRIVFSEEQELELVDYLREMDSLFYGLTRSEFMKLAYNFASRNKIPCPSNWKKNYSAGADWLKGFQSRHPEIVLRTPEPISVARARGFNRPQVDRFYSILWEQINKNNIRACTLFNMDETAITTTTHKSPKVLSLVGKKQVGVISSTERGVLTTSICCCNAAGGFIPPFLIFARKRMQERLLDNAPPGTQATTTESGWINGEAFLEWLQFSVEHTRPGPDNKVLLLLDNHESHNYYPALEFASRNNVVFVSFPPHTTHKMQPLDVAVYGPLKTYYEQEVSTFQKNHPGRIINQFDVAGVFAPAYLKAAAAQNAVNGFRSAGLWPYNPNVFGEEEFAPASVTNREVNENNPSTSQIKVSDEAEGTAHLTEEPPARTDNRKHCSPKEIRPLPKMTPEVKTRRRTCQKADVLTSTPIKDQQKAKMSKKRKNDAGPSCPAKRQLLKKESEENGAKTPDYTCTVCDEPYTEPPSEDWIQCTKCKAWSHESCTSYSGRGQYYCVHCE